MKRRRKRLAQRHFYFGSIWQDGKLKKKMKNMRDHTPTKPAKVELTSRPYKRGWLPGGFEAKSARKQQIASYRLFYTMIVVMG